MAERIFLDNAATSWPKPESVYRAVDDYLRNCGAAAGRSAYHSAQEAERIVADVRRRVARLLGAPSSERVVFTQNGTGALNLAIHGLLHHGDHVVTTCAEHNSVLRPLRYLEEEGTITVTRVAVNEQGLVSADELRAALRPNTRLVAMLHASNVTGAIQPVEAVIKAAHEGGARVLIDAAQSLGHLPINVNRWGVDLLAAPGHKGLLGPLGTGLLYIAQGLEQELEPLFQGGTGTQSEHDRQPDSLPDRYESGNINVAGLAGLAAGVAWLEEQGHEKLRAHEIEVTSQLLAGLRKIGGVQVFGPAAADERVGVVSFTCSGYDAQEAAAALDVAAGVQVRAGLHCAPLMHAAIGTLGSGGTMRMSVGPFTTVEQIDRAVEAVAELMRG